MRPSRRRVLGAAGAGAAALLAGCSGDDGDTATALVAGSLLGVADAVPGATVEAHGSAAVRRLVLEGLRDPDAVALADPLLFDGVADRTTLFATNALVLTYAPDTPHAAALRDDWRAVAADAVEVGRTDPDRDPLGYRTVMALRLAGRDGFPAERTLAAAQVLPETDLLNVLEAGGVDAAFTYRSMAVERELPFVALPDRLDFSDPAHAETYASVVYDLPEGTVTGAPIRYAATATTPAGEAWTDALVAGRERLRARGFAVPDAYPTRVATPGGYDRNSR
jgi:molybdate/tungstate transport system substrate-binding protein